MPASDFPYESPGRGHDLEKFAAQVIASLCYKLCVSGCCAWAQTVESPSLPASIATISRLMSVGLTPLMRLAWPSVSGLI
jgi:hypothetical protein